MLLNEEVEQTTQPRGKRLMTTFYCSDCPRSKFEGDIRDAAAFFADKMARKTHGRSATAQMINQVAYGSTSAQYTAFVGTYSKRDKHTVG